MCVGGREDGREIEMGPSFQVPGAVNFWMDATAGLGSRS